VRVNGMPAHAPETGGGAGCMTGAGDTGTAEGPGGPLAALRRVPAPLALAVVAVAAYAGTLGHELVWDDPLLLENIRTAVREGGLPRLLTAEFRVNPDQPLGYYRPLVYLSLYLDFRISGAFLPVFHATNVLLHAGNTLLLHALLRTLAGSGAGALLGGLLFAVHPVHTESVAFASGRTDLLAAFFVFLAALCWARDRCGAPPRHPLAWRAPGILAFAMGALSKEAAFLLPAALLAWDGLGLRGAGSPPASWWRRNGAWAVGFGGAVLAVLLLRTGLARVGFGAAGDDALQPGGAALSIAPALLLQYLRLLLFPWPLRAYYTPRELGLTPETVGAALLLLGICAATAGSGFRRAGLLALAWIATFLLPVSGLVPLNGAPLAERFLYIPSAGLSVLAAFAAVRAAEVERFRLPLAAAAAAVLALCLAGTASRSAVWRDDMTLYSDMIRTTPEYPVSYYNIGNLHQAGGRYGEAIEAYRKAIRVQPAAADAYNNLGNTYLILGSPWKAVEAYREALRIQPRHADARYNLGNAYRTLRLYPQAIESFSEALRIRPNHLEAYNNLGNTFLELGRYGDAAEYYRRVLRHDPAHATARYNLGVVLLFQGRKAEAMEQYRALQPEDPGMARQLLAIIDGEPRK